MPIDFTLVAIVKSAKRVFTAPITSANVFDAAIAALKAEDNPLGATAYQTAGETIDGVTTAAESYQATIEYVNALGKKPSAQSPSPHMTALSQKSSQQPLSPPPTARTPPQIATPQRTAGTSA